MARLKNKEVENVDPSKSNLGSFLERTKAEHYNFQDTVYYQVSTGSLILDAALGLIGPGLVRFVGVSQGGKTSESIQICSNFLKTVPNSKAIYIKAEGRLSLKIKEEGLVKFIEGDVANWDIGTCYVHESNVYENILELIENLILNNPTNIRYCFIIDSFDALILRDDKKKSYEESGKVAGGAVLSNLFFKKLALPLFKFGHLTLGISQVRSNIQIAYTGNNKQSSGGNSTGGNALIHFSDVILEYLDINTADWILENPNEKYNNQTNKKIGKWVTVEIRKATNQSKGQRLRYPIKFGRASGSPIWHELEIVDFMLSNGLLNKAGSWFSLEAGIFELLAREFPDVPDKLQGLKQWYDYFEVNNAISMKLKDMFLVNLMQYSEAGVNIPGVVEVVDESEKTEIIETVK